MKKDLDYYLNLPYKIELKKIPQIKSFLPFIRIFVCVKGEFPMHSPTENLCETHDTVRFIPKRYCVRQ